MKGKEKNKPENIIGLEFMKGIKKERKIKKVKRKKY